MLERAVDHVGTIGIDSLMSLTLSPSLDHSQAVVRLWMLLVLLTAVLCIVGRAIRDPLVLIELLLWLHLLLHLLLSILHARWHRIVLRSTIAARAHVVLLLRGVWQLVICIV